MLINIINFRIEFQHILNVGNFRALPEMKLPFAHKINIEPGCRFAFEDEIEAHKNVGTEEAEDKFFDSGSKSMSVGYFEDRLENVVGTKFLPGDDLIQDNHNKIKKLSEEEMKEFFQENDVKYTLKQLEEIQKTKFPINTWVLEANQMKISIEEIIAKNALQLESSKKQKKDKAPKLSDRKNVNILKELEIKEFGNIIFVQRNISIDTITFPSNEVNEQKPENKRKKMNDSLYKSASLNESNDILLTEEKPEMDSKEFKSDRGSLYKALSSISSNDRLEVALEQTGIFDRQEILKININEISPIKFKSTQKG